MSGGVGVLALFKRSSGTFAQIGATYHSGNLSAGTQIKVSAVGSSISCQENGTEVITATDASFTGGDPGVMIYETPTSDNWVGGDVVPPDTAPNTPTSSAQFKSDGITSITTGGWTNQTTVVFSATVTDPDSGDTDQLCIEVVPSGNSFTNTETSCGSLVSTGSTATDTISGLSDATNYKWQARAKDAEGLYASWTQFNSGSTAFKTDVTAPTPASVYDGSSPGVESSYSSSSLSSLSCSWSAFSDAGSGIASYDYSIGTTTGGITIVGWTNVSSATSTVTASSLALRTSQPYYCNVRADDTAGNVSSVVSSSGQLVAPILTFTVSTNSITFATLTGTNSWTDSESLTLTTSTNAYSGYSVQVYETAPPTSNSHTIADYSAPASAPTTWSGTGFGYTVSWGAAVAGFAGGTQYAHFGSQASPDTPVSHAGPIIGLPITNEQETVTAKVAASASQAAGYYATHVVWSCVATF